MRALQSVFDDGGTQRALGAPDILPYAGVSAPARW